MEIDKKDLERYYIDEEKSMKEISKIYECHWTTIRRKLELYKISIRPHGAFLVDDDGETLNSKFIKGELSNIEYKNRQSKRKGYKNYSDYNNKLLKNRGYESSNEYCKEQAKNRGYENRGEYNRKMDYKKGIGTGLSMSENKDCSAYLGVHICENKEFLNKIINIIENMSYNNPGYDVVCTKDKKVDVKCSCLSSNKQWNFAIKKNKIADYFLCISFDNRDYLNIIHIWLIKGNDVIEKTNHHRSEEFIFNEKDTVNISKGDRALKRWKKYEIIDTYKLEEAQKLCDTFKNDSKHLLNNTEQVKAKGGKMI